MMRLPAVAGWVGAAGRSAEEADLAPELQRHWLMLGPGSGYWARLPPLIEARSGYRITVVEDAAEVLRSVLGHGSPIDGVVLDMGTNEAEGPRLCRQLRQRGIRIPLLIMGNWSSLFAVLAGLESGANDFMPRECAPNVIAARMRCHLRNHDGSEHATFPMGGLRFHPAGRSLTKPASNRRVRLTESETRLLLCLLEAGGATVRRDVLAGQVWAQPVSRDGLLDPAVRQLQQKVTLVGGRVVPRRTAVDEFSLVRTRPVQSVAGD